MDNYEKLECIGEGTYGHVFKGRNINTGKLVALKHCSFESSQLGIPSSIIKELACMKCLHHKNILNLIDVVYSRDLIVLVSDFMNQDLSTFLRLTTVNIEPDIIKNILGQIFVATNFCHSKNILHRDLKPQNILINHNGRLKIADFGLARVFDIPNATYSTEVVTLWYRSPDVLMGSTSYTISIDIWSIGCIFGEIINSGIPIFRGTNNRDQLDLIFRTLGFPSLEDWPEVAELPLFKKLEHVEIEKPLSKLSNKISNYGFDLLQKLLNMNPNNRISAERALKHEYFTVHE